MFVVVCYDIPDNKRRTRVGKTLEGYGYRVQKSVFECELSPELYQKMKRRVEKLVAKEEDGVSVGTPGSYTFPAVHANHTISASFAINTYTITVTAGAHGSITPGTGTVNDGGTPTYTITADPGYHIADVLVDGVSVGAVTSYPFTNVTANHTIAASFAITGPAIDITSPNGGESRAVGSSQTITWTSSGVAGTVNIQLSRNGGTTWTTILPFTPNDGSQTWTVTGPATTQARIRVTSVSTPAVFDISDGNFTIVQTITVTSPNGGENWAVGLTQTITWTSVGVTGNVKIDLSRNGGATWTTILPFTPNDGSQTWTVTGPATTQARIRVTSFSTPTVFDISDGNFRIQ